MPTALPRATLLCLLASGCAHSSSDERSGTLAPDVLQASVHSHADLVERCYELGLARRPELEGRVVIDFVVGPDGRVAESSVAEDGLGDPETARCIAEAIRTWEFPRPDPPGGRVRVRYPFQLHQSDE